MPNPLHTACTGRPGVVYVNEGERRICLTNHEGVTTRFKCECHAKETIIRTIGVLVGLAALELIPVDSLPLPSDFSYEYIDEAPSAVEPTSCEDAKSVLAKFMEASK